MKPLVAVLIVSALVLLSGCAQRTMPYACQTAQPNRLANCIYVNSVLEQNPYYCYSIPDIDQRKTCLHDATEPSMKVAVERASQEEKNAVFANQPAPVQQPPVQQPPAQPQPPAQALACSTLSGDELNTCLKAAAISSLDISTCGRIADTTVRQSCISGVAVRTKDIASCDTLSLLNDVNLCKLYAKGEETKG